MDYIALPDGVLYDPMTECVSKDGICWEQPDIAELLLDSARYRFLRTKMFRNDIGHLDLGGDIDCNWHDPNKGEIDRTIDAAMTVPNVKLRGCALLRSPA